MGCCIHSPQIINPVTHDEIGKIKEFKQQILNQCEIFISQFENILLEKIVPSKPRSMNEFDKIINYSIKTACQSYDKFVKEFHISLQTEILQYKKFIVSKCKSKEGFFRFLNNFYSFEFIDQLKIYLIEKVNEGEINAEECIQEYNKHARGTFILEGLDEIYELLRETPAKRLEILDEKAENTRKKLQEDRDQLLLANNYLEKLSETPTINFVNKNEEIIKTEYLESQVYDLDQEYLECEYKSTVKEDSNLLSPIIKNH